MSIGKYLADASESIRKQRKDIPDFHFLIVDICNFAVCVCVCVFLYVFALKLNISTCVIYIFKKAAFITVARSGADFLGPLMPAVAEICSDFDPTANIEPSLLKLFRNLWFYIALFGLAPPIQKSQGSPKPVSTVSTGLSGVGSMSTIQLQAVDGPYLWNSLWASAIQRIAQATPPLVS